MVENSTEWQSCVQDQTRWVEGKNSQTARIKNRSQWKGEVVWVKSWREKKWNSSNRIRQKGPFSKLRCSVQGSLSS